MNQSISKTCLIVDDDELVNTLLTEIVSQLGFNVENANDGQNALEKCRSVMPDVILLDMYMPEKGGMEFLKEIRKRELAELTAGNKKRAKVIMCSAEDGAVHIGRASMAGADGYIIKPFCREKIRESFVDVGVL